MIEAVATWLPTVAVILLLIIVRRDLEKARVIEGRVDDQLHAIHEAMLLWEFGAKKEAVELLAEHDIFVGVE